MSYVPGFAPDCRIDWRAMNLELQELVLDEMERLAANPPSTDSILIDFVHESAGVRHYVWLRVVIDHARSRIHVVGLHHYPRLVAP